MNCCHKYHGHTAARCLSHRLYNDHLVNMIEPSEITGLSKYIAMKAALHAPQRFREVNHMGFWSECLCDV